MLTTKPNKIAVCGAGVVGRLLSLVLHKMGFDVTLFEKGKSSGEDSASFYAAGMISPFSELEFGSERVFNFGVESLSLWGNLLKYLNLEDVFYSKAGTQWFVPVGDTPAFLNLMRKKSFLQKKNTISHEFKVQRKSETVFHVAGEAQIDVRDFFRLSEKTLLKHVDFRTEEKVSFLVNSSQSGFLKTNNGIEKFDLIFDTLGMGSQVQKLRGVMGEVIFMTAKDIQMNCPVRVFSGRTPIYIAPKKNGQFVVGATVVEGYDNAKTTVEGVHELLSALIAYDSMFSSGEITEIKSALRPSFSSGSPEVTYSDKVIHINGMYRHGYLTSPAIINSVVKKVFKKDIFNNIQEKNDENYLKWKGTRDGASSHFIAVP